MASKLVALQPLRRWLEPAQCELTRGLRIRSLDAKERPPLELWNNVISTEEIRELNGTPAWLLYECPEKIPETVTPCEYADQLLSDTNMVLKVIAPIDMPVRATILCERKCEEPLHPISIIRHPSSLTSIGWARVFGYGGTNCEEIRRICESFKKAVARNITRIINPLRFLEHGLASNEIHVRLLLFVAGIDALLMASTPPQFEKRLCNLLGSGTLIFPEIHITGFGQPRYRVADLARDIYNLRSDIAHGRRIRPRYWRDPLIFEDVDKTPIASYYNIKTYQDLLHESSLFVLCRALRTVLLMPVERVEDTAGWRKLLGMPRDNWSLQQLQ